MNTRVYLAAGCLLASTPAHSEGWKLRANVDMEASSWEDDLDDEGFQAATLFKIAAVRDDLRLGVATGYVWADADSELQDLNGSVRTPLDTVVSFSWRGLRPKIGGTTINFSIDADASLPTGQRTLSGRERNVAFDPLLARFDRYGEGLNGSVGPSLAVKLSPTLTVGLGVKYTATGKYRPDGNAPEIKINPANTMAYVSSFNWAQKGSLIGIAVEVANEGKARRNGQPLLERGVSLSASVIGTTRTRSGWTLSGAGTYTTRGRDRRLNELTGELEREDSRRDGDIWSLSLSIFKQMSTKLELGLEGDFVSAGDSEIDDADFSYLPSRTRWRLGPSARLAIAPKYELHGSLKYIDYRDKGSALLVPLNARGVTVSIGLGASF